MSMTIGQPAVIGEVHHGQGEEYVRIALNQQSDLRTTSSRRLLLKPFSCVIRSCITTRCEFALSILAPVEKDNSLYYNVR